MKIHTAMVKQLLPGMLPLIVYIGCDFIFDTKTSMIIVALFSILEFLFSFFILKHKDFLILIDLVLVLTFSGLSLGFNNPVFFKIKPAILQAFLVVFLAVSAFSKVNLFALYSKRFIRQELDPFQTKLMNYKMRRGAQLLFFFIFPHTILIVAAAFFFSKEVWAFTTTVLPWVLIAAASFLILFEYKIMEYIYPLFYRKSEWFNIVRPDGVIMGKAPREVCHKNNALLHPVVHLFVFNPRGDLLMQKRSKFKKIAPSLWDTSVGGHISAGENVEQALARETFEEIGLSTFKPVFLYRYVWSYEVESELVYAFAAVAKGPFSPDIEEVEELKFWNVSDIEKAMGSGVLTKNFEFEYANFLSDSKVQAIIEEAMAKEDE